MFKVSCRQVPRNVPNTESSWGDKYQKPTQVLALSAPREKKMALKSLLLKYDIPKETLACLFWFYSFAFRGRVCIAQAHPEITL